MIASERILTRNCSLSPRQLVRLDPRRTRVEPPESGSGLVRLDANGITVEIGRFLTEWKRRELARELQSALALER